MSGSRLETEEAAREYLEFDPAKIERREVYRMSGRIVGSRNITQSAEGDKNGLWTTVVAAAVFLTR